MRAIDRRRFVFFSSGAALGNLAVPGLVFAAENEVNFSSSGLVTGELKPLKHKSIPGFLSAEQIAPHHTAHYGGALRGYSAADAKLEASGRGSGTLSGAEFGALKREVNSKGNSVVLHELYFDGMIPQAPDPAEDLQKAVEARFGSLDNWAKDFTECAKGAAGWAMLVKHPVNGKLYNVISDEHAAGVLWMAAPLVVIDTYEHAFYIDYQNRKAEYVERFLDHINWNAAGARWRRLG